MAKNSAIKNCTPIFASLCDTIYQLTPILTCIIITLSYNLQTIDKREISLLALPEWGFMATFLFVNATRDRAKIAINSNDPLGHVAIYLSLLVTTLSATITGLIYAASSNLIPQPIYYNILCLIQLALLAAALIYHYLLRHKEFKEELKKESQQQLQSTPATSKP